MCHPLCVCVCVPRQQCWILHSLLDSAGGRHLKSKALLLLPISLPPHLLCCSSLSFLTLSSSLVMPARLLSRQIVCFFLIVFSCPANFLVLPRWSNPVRYLLSLTAPSSISCFFIVCPASLSLSSCLLHSLVRSSQQFSCTNRAAISHPSGSSSRRCCNVERNLIEGYTEIAWPASHTHKHTLSANTWSQARRPIPHARDMPFI